MYSLLCNCAEEEAETILVLNMSAIYSSAQQMETHMHNNVGFLFPQCITVFMTLPSYLLFKEGGNNNYVKGELIIINDYTG